jgi:hypothetical protein
MPIVTDSIIKKKNLTAPLLENLCKLLNIGCFLKSADLSFDCTTYTYQMYPPTTGAQEVMQKLLLMIKDCNVTFSATAPIEPPISNCTTHTYNPANGFTYTLTFISMHSQK